MSSVSIKKISYKLFLIAILSVSFLAYSLIFAVKPAQADDPTFPISSTWSFPDNDPGGWYHTSDGTFIYANDSGYSAIDKYDPVTDAPEITIHSPNTTSPSGFKYTSVVFKDELYILKYYSVYPTYSVRVWKYDGTGTNWTSVLNITVPEGTASDAKLVPTPTHLLLISGDESETHNADVTLKYTADGVNWFDGAYQDGTGGNWNPATLSPEVHDMGIERNSTTESNLTPYILLKTYSSSFIYHLGKWDSSSKKVAIVDGNISSNVNEKLMSGLQYHWRYNASQSKWQYRSTEITSWSSGWSDAPNGPAGETIVPLRSIHMPFQAGYSISGTNKYLHYFVNGQWSAGELVNSTYGWGPIRSVHRMDTGRVVLFISTGSDSAVLIRDNDIIDDSLTFSITGLVREANNNPIPGVLISLTSNLSYTTAITTLVDATGLYTFSNLISDTYTLTPTKTGYLFSPVSASVALPPSATVNFTGTAVYSITGAVVDQTTQPLTYTLISLTSNLTSTTAITTLVDASGLYTFSNLISGTYTLTPTKERYRFTPISATVSLPPSVSGLTFTGTLAIAIDVFDLTGNLVTQLITNTNGWPTPNPLTATVTLACPSGGPACASPFTMTITSPGSARFYIFDRTETDKPSGLPPLICTFPISGSTSSYTSYTMNCNDEGSATFSVPAGEMRKLHWSVWIQPSEALSLTFAAEWPAGGGHNKIIQIPQAKIRPIVFIPGYVGTFPPAYGPEYGGDGKLEPIYKYYNNLMDALERAGYERGLAGSGATLLPYLYDWRQPLGATGSITLTNFIDKAQNPSDPKDYVDYDQVDLVVHSTGGLVARAYLENTSVVHDQTVHTLLTLGSPHQGVPGAYLGWYGGDSSAILSRDQFIKLQASLIFCENIPGINFITGWWSRTFPPSDYYDYFRNTASSIENFMPRADDIPQAYLVDSSSNEYPYPSTALPADRRPPSPFLDDLNTSGGLYDVTRLQFLPRIISSYNKNYQVPIQFEVGPPPNPSDPQRPDFWKYGTFITQTMGLGDGVVPDYSGDLTRITALSMTTNIIAPEELKPSGATKAPWHMGLISYPYMLRRIISYTTAIDLAQQENFWNIEYVEPNETELYENAVTCSPVRTLVIDPLGRRAGLDLDTGQVINEIPGAYVTEEGIDPQIISYPKIEGQYQVQAVGVDSGEYRIGVIGGITTPVVIAASAGQTTVGQKYQLNYGTPLPQEIGGQIVIEAEEFITHIERSNQSWLTQTTLSGYQGSSYLNTLSDRDLLFTHPYTTTSPELQYSLNFSVTGTYTVWLRGYAPNGAGDSIYLGLDDQPATTLTGFMPGVWSWAAKSDTLQEGQVTIEVTTPGVHILHLWQREDGLRLDRILLTTDSGYTPIGSGP
jgi:hypothetical protein